MRTYTKVVPMVDSVFYEKSQYCPVVEYDDPRSLGLEIGDDFHKLLLIFILHIIALISLYTIWEK